MLRTTLFLDVYIFAYVQNPGLPIQKLQDIQRAMELLSCQGPAKSIDEATKHKYQFWDTQPVPKLSTYSKTGMSNSNHTISAVSRGLYIIFNVIFVHQRHLLALYPQPELLKYSIPKTCQL